jgi:uncharacterized protein YndB with AHSA1/START domain
MPIQSLFRRRDPVKIAIETLVKSTLDKVWNAYNTPSDIQQWNSPHESWHTPHSTVDLREGGQFLSRMEARDGSAGFDFAGTYTRVVPNELIEYQLGDERKVEVRFVESAEGVLVKVEFDAEAENPIEMQRDGWQAILDSFARHVEAKG